MTFAERLKFARQLTGLSARRLAELAGVSPGYPGHLETGRRQNPPSAALSDIARVLGTTMDWLLNGVGAAPTEAGSKAAVAAAEAELADREPPPALTVVTPKREVELDDPPFEEPSEVSSVDGPNLVNPPHAPVSTIPPPAADVAAVSIPKRHDKPIPTPDPEGAI